MKHALLNSPSLKQILAEGLEYNVIGGNSLYLHKDGDSTMLLSPKDLQSQGWKYTGSTMIVSNDTLVALIGDGETSDDGIKEAEVVAAWMLNQQ